MTEESVRRAAVIAADANLRLAGLSASKAAKALSERWILGEIGDDELIELTKAYLAALADRE